MFRRQVLVLIGWAVVRCALAPVVGAEEAEALSNSINTLTADLTWLGEQVRKAEDDVIDFKRVNQVELVKMTADAEVDRLNRLVTERSRLRAEIEEMEQQYPSLGSYIQRVAQAWLDEQARKTLDSTNSSASATQLMRVSTPNIPVTSKGSTKGLKETAEVSETDHSKYDRLTQAYDRVENARCKWRSSYLLASQKTHDLGHLQAELDRWEASYQKVASELHDLKMRQGLKSIQKDR